MRTRRRFDESETGHRAALELRRQLVDGAPANPDYRRKLSFSYKVGDDQAGRARVGSAASRLGILLEKLGDRTEAEAAYRHSLELHEQLVADAPDQPQAVALAEKAVAAAPREADCWNTLGAARYRAGDFKGAVEALQKYRELREGDAEWSNPLFLAMAHWQLGEKEKAREWFDKGVEWMERKNVKSGVAPRLRAAFRSPTAPRPRTLRASRPRAPRHDRVSLRIGRGAEQSGDLELT